MKLLKMRESVLLWSGFKFVCFASCLANLIWSFQHGNTALHEAAWRGFSETVKYLCDQKAKIKQNKAGFSPLHLSCQAGHNQSTRELLLHRADPEVQNTYGDSPLHTAVRYGHAGVARILLSARACPHPVNKVGHFLFSHSRTLLIPNITLNSTTAACTISPLLYPN